MVTLKGRNDAVKELFFLEQVAFLDAAVPRGRADTDAVTTDVSPVTDVHGDV